MKHYLYFSDIEMSWTWTDGDLWGHLFPWIPVPEDLLLRPGPVWCL